MTKPIVFFVLLLNLQLTACMNRNLPEDPSVWNKIKLDFKNIDENGLTGPANGKVAVHYEFCISKDEKLWKRVQKIDSSAQKSDSRGRVGCTPEQWLVIGSTHQKNWKRVLYDLAAMPEVARIQQTFFE
ncbi:MAG: hypothetical protein SFV52_00430 [Saprospiraceae bacterium]|nr:hypothetical protein [Saprospiraceae bacterium]